MDKEHNVSVVCFFDDTLESVVTQSRISTTQSVVNQFRSRDHTVCDFYSRDSDCFLSDFCVELKVKFRFCHFRNVVECSFHRVITTHLVRDSLVVTFYLFTLEYGRLSFNLSTLPFQNRSYFNNCVLFEILFRELSVDSHRNFTTYSFQYLRSRSEVIR